MLLVREPLYVIGLILAYLFIVIKGPQWMAKREGFELRKALIVYNFFLVALSGWMMYEVLVLLFNSLFHLIHDTAYCI